MQPKKSPVVPEILLMPPESPEARSAEVTNAHGRHEGRAARPSFLRRATEKHVFAERYASRKTA
jgi:hypothetical protein